MSDKIQIPHDERHDVHLFDYSAEDELHGTGRHFAGKREDVSRHPGIGLLLGDTDSASKKQKMLRLFQQTGAWPRIILLGFTPVFLVMALLGPYIPHRGFIYASQRMQGILALVGGLTLIVFLILCKISHDGEQAVREANRLYQQKLEQEHKERKQKCGW